MSTPVSNGFKPSYGKTLFALGAVAGTAIVSPLASIAIGALYVGRTLFWNQNRKVEVEQPQNKPSQSAIVKAQHQLPTPDGPFYDPAPVITLEQQRASPLAKQNPPFSMMEEKPIQPTKAHEITIEPRHLPTPAIENSPFQMTDNSIRKPPLKLKTKGKRKRESDSENKPLFRVKDSLRCSDTLASRRKALQCQPAKISHYSTNEREKLKMQRRLCLLAENLGIDLDRDSGDKIDYLRKIFDLTKETEKSQTDLKRFATRVENSYIHWSKSGLSRSIYIDKKGETWILLDRQEDGDKVHGAGRYKTVTRAVNTSTLTVRARSVYKLNDAQTNAEIHFLKTLRPDEEGLLIVYSIDQYEDENGNCVTAVLQFEYQCTLMQFTENRDLKKFDRIPFAIDILKGMSHIHRRGLCHLDLKPQNVMIDRTKKLANRAVVIDYDQICPIGEAINDRGTDGYSAPELEKAKEQPIPSSTKMDMYSLHEILRNQLFPRNALLTLSERTQNLVHLLKDPNPANRPDVDEVLAAFQNELESLSKS